mmetsp:Transcript_18627/g.33666  ORF Transcript_18627/g.33666 Transcript_18627/m.33666 type:complete len:143 (-) Transcript_18627:12-440(-)
MSSKRSFGSKDSAAPSSNYKNVVLEAQLSVLPSSSAGRETSAKADELYQKLLSRNKKLNGQIERHGKEYKEKTQIRAQLHKAIEEEYMRILEDDYASYKNEKVVKEFKAKHAARIIWKWYTKCKAKKREIRPESIEEARDKA